MKLTPIGGEIIKGSTSSQSKSAGVNNNIESSSVLRRNLEAPRLPRAIHRHLGSKYRKSK